MKRKSLIAAALAASALAGVATVAQAAPAVVAGTTPYTTPYGSAPVYVQPAPPAPIYEVVPAPRAGFIWSPGHYVWDNGRYVWQGGQWLEARQGYGWQAAHWEQRADGSWQLVSGRWVRADNYAYDDDMRDRRYNSQRFGPDGDLDGDGVRNADDRDRDGDGVANRDDDFPNNRNRS